MLTAIFSVSGILGFFGVVSKLLITLLTIRATFASLGFVFGETWGIGRRVCYGSKMFEHLANYIGFAVTHRRLFEDQEDI